jgi:hypothetical protein
MDDNYGEMANFLEANDVSDINNQTQVEEGKAMGVLGFMKVPTPPKGDASGNWFKLKFLNFPKEGTVNMDIKMIKTSVPVNLNMPGAKEYIVSAMVGMIKDGENKVTEVTSINDISNNPINFKAVVGGKKRRSKTSSKRSKNRRSKKSRK